MTGKLIKLIIAIIVSAVIAFYFVGDSLWEFDFPGAGQSASFKMIGTVPAKTPENFGGFYRGFPGDSEKLTTQDDW